MGWCTTISLLRALSMFEMERGAGSVKNSFELIFLYLVVDASLFRPSSSSSGRFMSTI